MALTKIPTHMLFSGAASEDLSIDSDTLFIDSSANRVGIANNSPSVALDVTGSLTVSGTITGADLEIDSGTFSIDSSNNRIGIGTTSPESTLNIVSGSAGTVAPETTGDDLVIENSAAVGATFLYPDANAARILFGSPSNNRNAFIYSDYNSGSQTLIFGTGSGGTAASERMRITNDGSVVVNNSGGDAQIYLGGTSGSSRMYLARSGSDSLLWNVSNGNLRFGTNNSEAMRIDSSGNFMVGTTTAIDSDSGRGNITVNGSSNSILNFGVGGSQKGYIYHAGTDMKLSNAASGNLQFQTNDTERMRIDSSGQDGIGETTPDGMIHIKKIAGTHHLLIEESANTASRSWAISGAKGDLGYGKLGIYPGSSQGGTPGNTPTMTFEPDGNVGIGTASPTANLHVSAGNPNNSSDAIFFVSKTGSNDFTSWLGSGADDYGLGIRGVGSYAWAVYDHNAGAYRARLQFGGDLYLQNTTVNSISDRRLKKNIVDANSQWNDIKALRWRNFEWKDEHIDGTYLGLIADEVESISPNLVEINAQPKEDIDAGIEDPEHKAVKYSIVWMKAMKALQEAQERIETLEAKVQALESS